MIESNATNKFDGLALLSKMPKESVSCVFFDPQYRGVLDAMKFGNEKTGRQKARANLTQMDESTIKKFIKNYDRILKASGYMFLWLDKYELCTGSFRNWLRGTSLCVVDLIVWNKMHKGLGRRSRHYCEFVVVIQKKPKTIKNWTDHDIADVFEEKIPTESELRLQGKLGKNEKRHPHTKPLGLQKRLIEAVTTAGDTVIDCCAGSYSVLEACRETGRRCICCDIEFGEVWTEEMNIHK